MTNLSIIWSVTITVLGQMRALIQCYKYELVLTPTECSTFYGANVFLFCFYVIVNCSAVAGTW